MKNFYLLGDMGTGNKDQYDVSDALTKHIKNNINKNTFVCGLGDNIYESGCSSENDEQFNTKFEIPYKKIPNKVKFYMLLGNHDYGNKYNIFSDQSECAEYQVKYGTISQKKNMKWVMPSKYYTFNKGNIDFFVLDTNIEMYEDNGEDQLKYFIDKINKSKAKWKIVMGHHTWKSVGGHGNAKGILKKFFENLLKQCSFDCYFCGHDHNKQVINLDMFNKQVSLVVCGTGGKSYHDYTNYNLGENSDFIFCSNNLGYGYCEVEKNILKISFFDHNNNIEYIHEVSK